jgi:hypothetical protein
MCHGSHRHHFLSQGQFAKIIHPEFDFQANGGNYGHGSSDDRSVEF